MRIDRPSTPVLLLLGSGLLALGLQALCSAACFSARQETARASAQVVADLGLTDIALFTEARYTRHLSQADLFTPFQDAPMSLEHFPSGSLLAPPPHLRDISAPPPDAGSRAP